MEKYKGFALGLLLVTVLLPALAISAMLPEGRFTLNDVERFQKEIEMRIDSPPKEGTLIVVERNWAAEQLSSVYRYVSRYSGVIELPEVYGTFLTDTQKIVNQIASMDCDNIDRARSDYEEAVYLADLVNLGLFRSKIEVFETIEVKEYETFRHSLRPLGRFRTGLEGSQPQTFTVVTCKQLKSDFEGTDSLGKAKDLLKSAQNQISDNEQTRSELYDGLVALEKTLDRYVQDLSRNLNEVKTKAALEGNLHWVILAIGGLSGFAQKVPFFEDFLCRTPTFCAR